MIPTHELWDASSTTLIKGARIKISDHKSSSAEQIGGTIYLVHPNTLLASLFALHLHAPLLSGVSESAKGLDFTSGCTFSIEAMAACSKQAGGWRRL